VNKYLVNFRFNSLLFGNDPVPDNVTLYGVIPQPPTNCQSPPVVPVATPCVRGLTPSKNPFKVASGEDGGADTFTHEMAHILGIQHPFKGSAEDSNVCGNTKNDGAMDRGYPYTDGLIGPTDELDEEGNSVLEGFDSGTLTAMTVNRNPSNTTEWYDVISYCRWAWWISDYNYVRIYHSINGEGPHLDNVTTAAASTDSLLVLGVIVSGAAKAAFTGLSRLPSTRLSSPDARGTYTIQLLNAQGGVLLDHPFTPAPLHSHSDDVVLDISEVVPFVAGATQVRIVQAAGGQVLTSQAISAHPPSVSGVALQGAPSPVVGNVTLGWNASDPDGDALTFDIYYSHNGGASFLPLQVRVTGTNAQINTSKIGGGQGVFRVVAHDGVNMAKGDSTPVNVANKPPQPRILNPGDDARIHWGTLINFIGEASDLQDGSVSASRLVWTDQKGAKLGTGAVLTRDNLPVGVNKITLTATNSAGLSASASVTVIVDDDLTLPGPTLSVGPTQIGWHVAPGTTTPQTAQLTISNAGSGDLNWTASSNQPWLTVSATSGTVKAREGATKLTVTANPSGLQRDKSHLATLTLTKPATGGEPAQTIVIPVSLNIGNIFNPPVQAPPSNSRRIYLPFMRR